MKENKTEKRQVIQTPFEYKCHKVEILSGDIWVGKEKLPTHCYFVKGLQGQAFFTVDAAEERAKQFIDSQEAAQ
jgi:hypothetical protein